MAATKIILKRSSIPGKRPNTTNLEAGELAVNTNANEPGLFFEVTDGQVVKVGPTAYLPEQPTTSPARGELWFDTDTNSLSIGNTVNEWQKVAAPFLGGTSALTVFVAPDFPEASDSLENDGQSIPFVTINRAIIEVTKKIIINASAGYDSGNNRYLIVLAPSRHCVVNGPGVSAAEFSINFDSDPYQTVTQDQLQQFNGPDGGGLIVPRGVSIIGLDLKKCQVHPIHVPAYTHPAFPTNFQQTSGGPVYQNESLSSIFKWTGNTYLSNFSALDKIETRPVETVGIDPDTGVAIFGTSRPHGLDYNDFVYADYTNDADQAGATFLEGGYYANPITATTFSLSSQPWGGTLVNPVLASSLPLAFFPPLDQGKAKLNVSNIYPYYVPQNNDPYELSNYSHHRLCTVRNCNLAELNEFYAKVQQAFPVLFGGAVNKGVASLPEYQIVAEAQSLYPQNLATNNTDWSSPYLNQVNLRSDYGMCHVDADGELVTGFKSVIVNSSTAVSLQKDPSAYEIYADTQQVWLPLTALTQEQLPLGTPIVSVPKTPQLELLNQENLPNIRFYYETIKVANGQSTGLTDINNDFRHFGFRIRGAGAYMQTQSTFTIGTAVGAWAMGGAIMNLTNSTSNFGSNAFQAEGFAGIGTLGGATQVGRGFLQSGIVRPLALTEKQVVSDAQKRILSLGSGVAYVGPDPDDSEVTLIYLKQPFNPASILPYSLRPGTAVFFVGAECTYTSYFVDNGTPTCILSENDPLKNPYALGGAILRVWKSSSSIPNGPNAAALLEGSFPYIRRFIDPRAETEKCYGFYIQSTNPSSQAPQVGSVLRLNQTGQNLSTSLKRNYQFDPGQFGGIAQTFTVNAVETGLYNFSVNYNNKIADAAQSDNYVVYASLSDAAGPWIQSYPNVAGTDFCPYNTPEGSYLTNNYRNYYAAENNLWVALYYSTTYNPENGPTKVSPNKQDSPFVDSAILDRQEQIQTTWQGYVPDPLYDYYLSVPTDYNSDMTYLRGAVIPNKEFANNNMVDYDDGTPSLGIIFSTIPVPETASVTTSAMTVLQSYEPMTSAFVSNPTFGRPGIVRFNALSVSGLESPKNGISIIRLTNSAVPALNGVVEYMRVIGLASNSITAIRNYYPSKAQGTTPVTWPVGSKVEFCISDGVPQAAMYDPGWSVTKATIRRYYELMGFDISVLDKLLEPKPPGERVLLNTNLSISPINGYATKAASWPVEFNIPSSIYANTHTWTFAGYLDYSRGLPKYQTNELSRKVTADFEAYSLWGGKITCLGVQEDGATLISGDFREAFTLNPYNYTSDWRTIDDNVGYNSPAPIEYPKPVLVYSADDITGGFNAINTTFNLSRGGFAIPPSQLTTTGLFVFLGGVAQLPGSAYNVQGSTIVFSEPPQAGTSCDIRIITTDDSSRTLDIVTFAPNSPFNGSTTSFQLTPDYTSLDDGNSLVFLGGVLQDPLKGATAQNDFAYTIDNSSGAPILTFIGAAPLAGTTLDIRGVLSGNLYRSANIPIVYMTSTDEISTQFDGAKSTFELTVGGVDLDAYKVNAENMFVNLGGVMQIPIANAGAPVAGLTYTVTVNATTQAVEITFAQPPTLGTTCNIRVITQDEFITCPIPDALANQYLKSGPGVETTPDGELIGIDEGLIT
jgi:hypothetical protein